MIQLFDAVKQQKRQQKINSTNNIIFIIRAAANDKGNWTCCTKQYLYKDLIQIPIHHRSITREGQRWSIMVGLFVQKKIICHCNSLCNVSSVIHSTFSSFTEYCSMRCEKKIDLNESTFNTPLDISQQRNNHDCGVFTCLKRVFIVNGNILQQYFKTWFIRLIVIKGTAYADGAGGELRFMTSYLES